jgi:RNA recognition motif-containing protein
MNIYVGNLSYDAKEDDLANLFAAYGDVTSVKIPTDRFTGKPRGFGFVEMSSDDDGTSAIEALDQNEFLGRPLKVNEARQRER